LPVSIIILCIHTQRLFNNADTANLFSVYCVQYYLCYYVWKRSKSYYLLRWTQFVTSLLHARMYVRTQFIKNDNSRHLHECNTNFVIEGNW